MGLAILQINKIKNNRDSKRGWIENWVGAIHKVQSLFQFFYLLMRNQLSGVIDGYELGKFCF